MDEPMEMSNDEPSIECKEVLDYDHPIGFSGVSDETDERFDDPMEPDNLDGLVDEDSLDQNPSEDKISGDSRIYEEKKDNYQPADDTMDISSAPLKTPNENHAGWVRNKKSARSKTKTCPICKLKFAPNGFYMHVSKCVKYKGWACAWCGVGVTSFHPKPPLEGPDGPYTLCQTCGKKYKKECKKKIDQRTPTTRNEGENLSKKNVPDRDRVKKAGLFRNGNLTRKSKKNNHQVDSTDSEYQEHENPEIPKRFRREPEPKPNHENFVASASSSSHSLFSDSSDEANDNKSAEKIKRSTGNESRPAVKEIEINKTIGIGEIKVPKKRGRKKKNVWTSYHGFLLLSAALKNPKYFVEKGPGLWMISLEFQPTADKEQVRIDISFSEKYICDRWNELPTVDLKFQIMAACHACIFSADSKVKREDTKSIALLSAKWHYVPPTKVDTVISESMGVKDAVGSRFRWHRPDMSPVDLSALTADEYVNSSLTTHSAWEEHMDNLRNKVNNHLKASISELPAQSVTKSKDVLANDTKSSGVVENIDLASDANSASNTDTIDDANEEVDYDSNAIPTPEGGSETSILTNDKSKSDTDFDISMLPRTAKNTMVARRRFVLKEDPRPAYDCSWCGPKVIVNGYSNQKTTKPSCEACTYFYKLGWKMDFLKRKPLPNSKTQYAIVEHRFLDPLGYLHRSVKSFLQDSSPLYVAHLRGEEPSTPQKCDDSTKKLNTDKIKKEEKNVNHGVSKTLENVGLSNANENGNQVRSFDNMIPLPTVRRLPTIQEILSEEEGLGGIIRADHYRVLHTTFGTCMDIAVRVLGQLSVGKLPYDVHFETPFLRPIPNLMERPSDGGPPPIRFVGVQRFEPKKIDVNVNGENNMSRSNVSSARFGVEIPAFSAYSKCQIFLEDNNQTNGNENGSKVNENKEDLVVVDQVPSEPVIPYKPLSQARNAEGLMNPFVSSPLESSPAIPQPPTQSTQPKPRQPPQQQQQQPIQLENGYPWFPPAATTGGKTVFLRADIDREEVAGKLYSYIFSILYGSRAARTMRSCTNGSPTSSTFIKNNLQSFHELLPKE